MIHSFQTGFTIGIWSLLILIAYRVGQIVDLLEAALP